MTTTTLNTSPTVQAPTFIVSPWRDPVVERVGFDACGDYVELFWLATLGPTATWVLRRCAVIALAHPTGFTVDAGALATAVGLGSAHGRIAALQRALDRLALFGLARMTSAGVEVRTAVPPLTLKQLCRLPEHLQSAHSLWNDVDSETACEFAHSCGQPVSDIDARLSAAS